jgi:biotin transport system substrate-specific component
MPRTESNLLIDYYQASRSFVADLLWVGLFSLFTATMAQIRIPLPFTPVPLTGQTFAVLLSGAVLGSRRGFAAQALYLAEGAAGLPVFAGGTGSVAHLLGVTGGYLWSYPIAAGLVGWMAGQGASRKVWKLIPALCFSDVLILASGGLWLHHVYGFPYRESSLLGFYPFLIGDMLKIMLLGISLPRILVYCQSRARTGDAS